MIIKLNKITFSLLLFFNFLYNTVLPQKDSTYSIFFNADIKCTPADRSITSISDGEQYNGQSGITIFENYYKDRFITDISIEGTYKSKWGLMAGIRSQFYPTTIYGRKLNNFFLIGYSKKIFHSRICFNIRLGFTSFSLSYFEKKNVKMVSYLKQSWDTIKGYYYVIDTAELIYNKINDLYADIQINYMLNKKVGISFIASILREYAYSNISVPRGGIGAPGYSYNYKLYIKSIGIGITYKIR